MVEPTPPMAEQGTREGMGEARASAIDLLVTYFTGSNVAANSIGLQLGGHAMTLAQPYFALRSALGIEGYVDRDEAAAKLSALLSDALRTLDTSRETDRG